jgi:hypothetical protein
MDEPAIPAVDSLYNICGSEVIEHSPLNVARRGRNVVRIVVRDGDGKAMAARDKGTGIP